ncbi:hypothetical protein CONPUDRAFT_160674 [Coniophora puteana RWD-64-598 SS2]|uniref:Uncharacterized protein n=1 Tax=Coniophora puteana (strain RWD-64-598) TaxID=741705 RepID=R7SD89_CONPW|nr:uncharacterized protein CONPUDRAFT_160674 [Coniophora puteana RWD-64-598 SS2]EIW73825.1 hypothetical protein CONPUDRAFT_160674 [Coniophora puteana RWD-64-598 SS2]
MAKLQTAEERALIAKWNAGDYSAQGWVNNTDGLTKAALYGLADYNTKKYFNTNNIDEVLPGFSDADTFVLPQNFAANAISDAPMVISTARVNNIPSTIAEVRLGFTPELNYFRARFQYQQGVGNFRVNGQVQWTTGGAVSNEWGPALLEADPAPQNEISLTATTSDVPPKPRLHFTGPSGGRALAYRGTGRYGNNP